MDIAALPLQYEILMKVWASDYLGSCVLRVSSV